MLDIFYPSRAALLADLRKVRAYGGPASYCLKNTLAAFVCLPDGAYMARDYL